MKTYTQLILGLLACSLLVGCKDDIATAGAGALSEDEEVRVRVKTLSDIHSTTIDSVPNFSITQTPDSFLIGECNTQTWATIKADLLTQFACPEGFEFPKDISDQYATQVDSVALMMTYTSWFADGNSPLRVTVYEMDKQTLAYTGVYTSHEDVSQYWSGLPSTHVVQEDQIVVAARPNDSIYSSATQGYIPVIRFMMNQQFVNKFNAIKRFPSQRQFNEDILKGLYITTTAGASTALYVGNIQLAVYYHYYYEQAPGSGNYQKVDHVKYLYANNEVRQVNRYSFPYKDIVLAEMQKDEDSLNYVVSPGYVYTSIKMPVAQYADTILQSLITARGDTLQPYVNKAVMRVDVLNVNEHFNTSDKWANPASDMLLIRKDSLASFFANHRLPSPEYCLLATLSASINDDNQTYSFHYDFDVSTLLYNELHRCMEHHDLQDIEMVMVPVFVEYSSTSSATVVSKIKINQTITYTILRSAQRDTNPLDIDVVYSGFTINTLH